VYDANFSRKIAGPTLPSVMLHRKALVTQLQETIAPEPHQNGKPARYKLVLCCAPAGYGKTVLLADFVYSTSLPSCWYFLEPIDTDPVVFLRTLLASLRHTFPQFGASLDPLFRTLFPAQTFSSLDIYRSALDALCSALATEVSERFFLLLCNYEEINESETLTSLTNYLLEKLPSQATLIIESRAIPDLSFAPLVIHDAMCGMDSHTLRFSAQDIADLASLQGLPPLTEDEAKHLATSFDGWIAGILLGTRIGDARVRLLKQDSLSNKPPSTLQVESLAEYKRNMLFTYMVDEVLKRDEKVYTFLQAISILQQIEPAFCNTLLDITDAAERLARLEHQGLFLASYESVSGVVYTCHPVIRELLSKQLHDQEPERFKALHRRAAELWRARHDDEQAMYHALKIGAYDLAVSLILNAAEHLLQQGQRATLMRWLHALPSTVQEDHPRLLLLQATIALERGQPDSAFPLIDRAETLAPALDQAEISGIQAMIEILRSKALFQLGEYLQSQVLCQQILSHVSKQDYALQATAEMRLGMCATLLGDFTAGITHLQQALHIWANHPPLHQAIEIYSALANTYYLTGNFPLAQHYLTMVLNACEQIQDVPGKISGLILQGLIAQDQGLTSEAEAAFFQVRALTSVSPYAQRGEAYALVNLGSLYVEQGKYAQALAYAQNGLSLARTFGNRSLINSALSTLALSYLFLGDPVSALFTVEQMKTPDRSSGTVGYERVWRDLTYGLILLSQQQYSEAAVYLLQIEAALNITDLKRERFQAKLRLAACQVAQDQLEQAVLLLEEVTSLLAVHYSYRHLVEVELQWLPDLLPVVQTHPRLASLRALLGISGPPQIQNQQDSSRAGSVQVERCSPRLTIYAFGEPTVLLDDQPIKRWRMAHAMELFFFLLDSDYPVSKETILTTLWWECDEQTTQIFHNTIYQLRKLLGEACVVFRSTGYSLDLPACYGEQVWYDVQAFQQHRAEAEQALAMKNEACAKEALLKMVSLYRGDYGRSFYNDWCTRRRDELRTAYAEARRQLAQSAWNAEDWLECAEHWHHLLLLDNCLEEAHYGLMRCYMRLGRRGAALRQYQSCRTILEKELGVQPGQAIQSLYQRLTGKHSAE
jgi:ATP/maltotriose-dependent transcriptional regulator MalT/DNA-binding SARP family transcriptional activator